MEVSMLFWDINALCCCVDPLLGGLLVEAVGRLQKGMLLQAVYILNYILVWKYLESIISLLFRINSTLRN
jgi:hypothetical protein